MGSVISPRHLARIEEMVQRGTGDATLLAGGSRLLGTSELDAFDFSQGSFFPPTVIADVSTDSELWREEVFGPVVVCRRFSVRLSHLSLYQVLMPDGQTEAEGVALANDSKYGLGAGIWTSDLSRAHRVSAEIEAGLVWVNTHHRNDPSSPWCVSSLLRPSVCQAANRVCDGDVGAG